MRDQRRSGETTTTRILCSIIVVAALVGLTNLIAYHRYAADVHSSYHDKLKYFGDISAATREWVSHVDSSEGKGATTTGGKVTVDETNPTQTLRETLPDKQDSGKQESTTTSSTSTHHDLSKLSCEQYGGPSNDDSVLSEMIYWSDIEADSGYKSPFYDENKYLTFEPDHGGWNNIRMAMETVLVLAHATGRTLVLPPQKKMYLLGKSKDGHKSDFSFNDFFHLESVAVEHEGLNIITMDEFLKRKGITGELKNIKTGDIEKPPEGRTDWNAVKTNEMDKLWGYLRKVGASPGWETTTCVAAIPSSPDPKHVEELVSMMDEIKSGKYGPIPDNMNDFEDKPTPVDAPAVERLREMMSSRQKLCIYDEHLQEQELIHFKVTKDDGVNTRLLTHFYAFVFFQDWRQDLWTKRFIRDHVRYLDQIVCAAARIVKAVRERSKSKNNNGRFDTFHVRRGDFQYKKTRIEATQIYEKSKDQLTHGNTLYIATDERDKTFFKPLADKYDVTYLDDYMDLIEDMNPNYYGMLDQLVAYKGDAFFGTWFSSLSGYINRMRGYYSVKKQLEGHDLGKLSSYYFVPEDRKFEMIKYKPVRLPIYMREFPVCWRDIDKGISELHEEMEVI